MKLIPGTSRNPLYYQVVDILKAKIRNETLKVGDKLPSEHELMKDFGVSRITVRKAVSELAAEGLVYSIHGKGTFVAEKRIKRTLGKLLGYIEELEIDGFKAEVEVVKAEFETPTLRMIEALRIEPDDQVFKLERLISVMGEPLLVDYGWFPKAFGRYLETADLRKGVHYHVLELAGLKLSHAVQEITAGTAVPADAALLKIKPNTPVLLIDRVTYAKNDIPVSFSKAVYRADRYSYKVDLTR